MNKNDQIKYIAFGFFSGLLFVGVVWMVDDYYQWNKLNEAIAEQYRDDVIVEECQQHIEDMFFKIRSDRDYDYIKDNDAWEKYSKLGCNKKLEFEKVDLLLMKEKLKSEGVLP